MTAASGESAGSNVWTDCNSLLWRLASGQAVDLGVVTLRQERVVQVLLAGVWAPGHAEPWWLATNVPEPLADIVVLCDRRMPVEEQLGDAKGCRFGIQLEWMQFCTPAYLARTGQLDARFIRRPLPLPRLRRLSWLQSTEGFL
ncbi:MAG: hypothetical protein HYZ81_06710 [Nitrospinae bacterium]|nr:hypothetical protein [Nitrospinota bacterium]